MRKLNDVINVVLLVGINGVVLMMGGCASVKTDGEWNQLKNCVGRVDGVRWVKDAREAQLVCELVEEELACSLTEDAAVRIAMMNNKVLQAKFEEIGIGKADLVQAGLFKNPSLSMLFRFPFSGGRANVEAESLFGISDLWLMPVRKEMARARLHKILLGVGDEVLRVRRDVKLAYNDAHYNRRLREERRRVFGVMLEMYDEAKIRHEWGYMRVDEVDKMGIMHKQEEIRLDEEVLRAQEAMVRLSEMLGVRGGCFDLSEDSIMERQEFLCGEKAVGQALEYRLDVREAKFKVWERRRVLELARRNIVKDVGGGPAFERDSDGKKAMGVMFDVELPVFDQNQAQIAKVEYGLRMAEKELMALQDHVIMEVRMGSERLEYLRKKKRVLLEEILPLQEKVVGFAEKWQGAMQINYLEYLESKRNMMLLEIELLETQKEFERELIRFEYLLGR